MFVKFAAAEKMSASLTTCPKNSICFLKRQVEFLGPVVRKEGSEELMLTGSVNGKGSRGRQRLTFLGILSKWMIKQIDETEKSEVAQLKILKTAKDRELWRSMVTNVIRDYGTPYRVRCRCLAH